MPHQSPFDESYLDFSLEAFSFAQKIALKSVKQPPKANRLRDLYVQVMAYGFPVFDPENPIAELYLQTSKGSVCITASRGDRFCLTVGYVSGQYSIYELNSGMLIWDTHFSPEDIFNGSALLDKHMASLGFADRDGKRKNIFSSAIAIPVSHFFPHECISYALYPILDNISFLARFDRPDDLCIIHDAFYQPYLCLLADMPYIRIAKDAVRRDSDNLKQQATKKFQLRLQISRDPRRYS